MGNDREGEGKRKGEYIQWRPEESKMLIELTANCFKKGLSDGKGRMFKKTVETKILPVLNKTFKSNKTYKHYINRLKILKNLYRDFVKLLCFSSKFEWNPITKKLMAPTEVWNAYFRDYPNKRHMRHVIESYEEYENMMLVFGKNKSIMRLERSYSQASEVGTNEKLKQEVLDLTNDDDDEFDESSMEVPHGCSLNLANFVENPIMVQENTSGDASVTEKDILKEVCTELRLATKQMVQVMQGRSSMQVEKKKNNVWDAITEIPNLTNNTRYKALNMILKLEMRDIFVDMSTEDRLGWIQCSTQ